MYGKATESAIAAMTRLAEVYDGGETRISAESIAEERGLPKPFVAKILTTLAQAGLVVGSRGPGGGFSLALHPKKICLYDVYQIFERDEESATCPFGGGVCGEGDPCPLHDKLIDVQQAIEQVLHHTTFEPFRVAYQEEGRRPTKRAGGKRRSKRESYRAGR